MGCNNSKGVETPKQSAGASSSPAEAGPDLTVKTEDVEVTFKVIHSAIRWNKPDSDVEDLVSSKERANMRDTGNGNFPLHIAAQNGHFNLVKMLVEKGAEINCQNNKLNTPLHMSLSYDYIEVSEWLIGKGADIDLENASGMPARKGIDGDKCLAAVYLGEAQSTADLLAAFQMCSDSVTDLDKASFAALGLRQKKTLGADIWTSEVQEKFKAVMLQL
jgi:ankyrin repeat protein